MRHLTLNTVAVVVASLSLIVGMKQAEASPVIPVGSFTGSSVESWESFTNYLQLPSTYLTDPTPIMSGAATISNSSMAIYQTSGNVANFGLGSSGTAQSIAAKGMGIDDPISSTTTITFSSPMSAFGAHWAAITTGSIIPATVTVTFFDVFNVPLDTVNFQYSQATGALDWHGWGAAGTETFKSLSYTGIGVAIDELQATLEAPEPATLGMLVFGVACLAGYTCLRRKAG